MTAAPSANELARAAGVRVDRVEALAALEASGIPLGRLAAAVRFRPRPARGERKAVVAPRGRLRASIRTGEHLRAEFESAARGLAPADRLVALSDEGRRVRPFVHEIADRGLNRFLEHALLDDFVRLVEEAVDGAVQESSLRQGRPAREAPRRPGATSPG